MKLETVSRQNRAPVGVLSHISLILLLALVLASPFLQMTGSTGASFKPYRLYGYAAMALLQAILILGRGWRKSLRIVATPASAVLVWFLISLVWADHIELAGKRLLLTSILYIVLFSSAYDLGYQRFIGTLRAFLALALILNFAVVFAFPDIGTHKNDLWRGFLANKNIAGIVSATTVILFAFDGRKIPIVLRCGVITGSLLFLYQSWSRTPMFALPITCLFGFAITRLKIKSEKSALYHGNMTRAVVVIFAMVIIMMVVLTVQRDFFISLTDDTAALSLRNAIWRPMVLSYLDNPLLGVGYGSYWDATVSHANVAAFSTTKWLGTVDQGHNGYLDLLVQTGLPGLVLALGAAFVWPMLRFIPMLARQKERTSLIFALLVLFFIENFTETSLFSNDVFGNLMVLSVLAILRRFELKSNKLKPTLMVSAKLSTTAQKSATGRSKTRPEWSGVRT